jgi:hypothetical protein
MTDPYKPPQVDSALTTRNRVPLWLRIKRVFVGIVGLALLGLSIFMALATLQRFGIFDGWHMLLMALVLFLSGLLAIYTAVRGRQRTIRDINLLP